MSDILMNIPELEDVPKLHDFSAVFKLAGFVYSIVSHSENIRHVDLNDLLGTLRVYRTKEFSGWCFANAFLFHSLIKEYNRASYVYDYGFPENELTHTVAIVTINGEEYLIDPYFYRYYGDENKNPYTFKELLKKAKENPDSVISHYGEGIKQVKQGGIWENWGPQKLENSVVGSWRVNCKLDEVLRQRTGNLNPLSMLPYKASCYRIVKNANGYLYEETF